MEKLIMKKIQIKDRQPPLRIQVEKGYRAFHREESLIRTRLIPPFIRNGNVALIKPTFKTWQN